MSKAKVKNFKVKKKRINKKKLAFVIVVFFLFFSILIFGAFKLTQTIFSRLDINFNTKNKQVEMNTDVKSNNVEKIEQFDLDKEAGESNAKKYRVFIDPGHGGNDIGSKSFDNTIIEKDSVLDISKKVASYLLKQDDIEVILSRTEDTYLSLSERANMATSKNSDVLVSLHLNSHKDANEAFGIETYYLINDKNNSETFAKTMQKTLVSYVDTRDRGVKSNDFEVLRSVNMPAILIEIGFLSNPEEVKKLSDENYKNELAKGIAQGILTYLDENIKK